MTWPPLLSQPRPGTRSLTNGRLGGVNGCVGASPSAWLPATARRGVKKHQHLTLPTLPRPARPPPRARQLVAAAARRPRLPAWTSTGAHTPVAPRAGPGADTRLAPSCRAPSHSASRALSAPRSALRAAARGAELVARAIAEPAAEAPAGRQYTLNKAKKADAKPKAPAREVTLAWADVQVGQQYKGVVVRGHPGSAKPQPCVLVSPPRARLLTPPPAGRPPVPHRRLRRVHQHRHRHRRPGPHLPARGAPSSSRTQATCGGGRQTQRPASHAHPGDTL